MTDQIRIEFQGLSGLKSKLDGLSAGAEQAVRLAVARTANAIRTDAVKLVQQGPKTGHIYGTVSDVAKVQSGGRGSKAASRRVHQASAPGEAPASDTGNLARSIRAYVDQEAATATVKAETPYAGALEFGTTRMAARPFLLPAFEMNRASLDRVIRDAWRHTKKD